jgi:hypothetical protein
MRLLRFGLPLVFAGLTGCATVFHGTRQKVDVFTDPPGATAVVRDQRITTPGTLNLPRKAKLTEVRIEKEGYAPKTVGVAAGAVAGSGSSAIFGLSSGGAAAGGVLAPTVLFASDYGIGGAYRLVPSKLVLRLEPLASPAAAISAQPPTAARR